MKTMLMSAALVGSGGFIGAICRFAVSGIMQRNPALAAFPYGTLMVNMVGCLLIGLAVGLLESRQLANPDVRSFVIAGILGGFTTYSAFGFETFALLRDAEILKAASNVLIHIVAGLFLVWIGYTLTSK
jgi:CrcB protein